MRSRSSATWLPSRASSRSGWSCSSLARHCWAPATIARARSGRGRGSGGRGGGLDVAAGAGCQPGSEPSKVRPVLQQHPAELGLGAVQPPGQPEACAETSAGSSSPSACSSSTAPKCRGLVHGGAEELFLAVEVVVERAQAHVRGLGDLQDRDLGPPGGEKGLDRADQRGAVRALRRSRRLVASPVCSAMLLTSLRLVWLTPL